MKPLLLLLAVLPFTTGCGLIHQVREANRGDKKYIGLPISAVIVDSRIPDKEMKLDDGRVMYEWVRCSGDGSTDALGNYSSGYRCKHTVAITKEGLVQTIAER